MERVTWETMYAPPGRVPSGTNCSDRLDGIECLEVAHIPLTAPFGEGVQGQGQMGAARTVVVQGPRQEITVIGGQVAEEPRQALV